MEYESTNGVNSQLGCFRYRAKKAFDNCDGDSAMGVDMEGMRKQGAGLIHLRQGSGEPAGC